jgi:hypothetical protein
MSNDPNQYPPGWDRQKVQDLISHYESQTEDEATAEDEAAFDAAGQTMLQVPTELVPAVLELIENLKKTA